jgi:hypothetical protein
MTFEREAADRERTAVAEQVEAAGGTPQQAEAAANQVKPKAPTLEDGLTVILRWVPGEIIATYTAVVLAYQPENTSAGLKTTSWLLLAFFVAAAALMTLLGGVLQFFKDKPTARKMRRRDTVELAVRAILSGAAFLLWSYVIPGSASSGEVRDEIAAVVVPLIALIFGLVAEFLLLKPVLGWFVKRI